MPDYDPNIDVRPAIAFGRHYDPAKQQHAQTTFQEYPKFIHIGEGKDRQSFIANNRAEENAILGRQDEPAKIASVDITNLEQRQVVEVKKRGRPKKEVLPLPKDLD